jgi:hypothetical protein
MKKSRKEICFLALILMLILSVQFINAVTVVQVEDTQPEQKGVFDDLGALFKSNIFKGFLVFVFLFTILAVILFFVVRAIIKYIKLRNDIFWQLKSKRQKLAKIHRRYPSKHWWKVEKNIPIRLVKKREDGKVIISNPIAYHRGDYLTHEGNVVISMNLKDNKKWFFIPITDLLIIPNREEIKITQKKDKDGNLNNIVIKNLPKPEDIIQFNEDEIQIFAESLSVVGMFHIPVLKAKDGKIIDLSLPVYQTLKEVILGDYLYEQSSEFVGLAKKSMDLNPFIRAITKTSDTNQNIDVPSDKK